MPPTTPPSHSSPGIQPPGAGRSRLLTTGDGRNTDSFSLTDWSMFLAVAMIWGSSFLLIDVALEAFPPGVIVFGRIAFGALVLVCVPRARRTRVESSDLPRVALLGMVWMAIPLTLFPIAQQWIDSSVPGMINGGMPLMTALWASLLLGRLPGRTQMLGLSVGLIGIVAIFLPELPGGVGDGSPLQALGVGLSLVAIFLYGLAANIAVPLQQKYGSTAVLLRAQLVALIAVAPYAVISVPDSHFQWSALVALVALGTLGTGLAFVLMTNLVGSVGGPRGAAAIYLVPVVAIVLGVALRAESVHPIALVGTAFALLGAWLTSRRDRRATSVRSLPKAAHPGDA